jgi:2-methylcitrate dehydratase PrpD
MTGQRPLTLLSARVASISREVTVAEATAARRCISHFLTCALEGRELPWSQAALRLATPAENGATAIGRTDCVVLEDAAFANAVLGQSTLAEDVHVASLVHPGSIVVPAALAAAEERNSSGRELLAAVIAGYDVACALGATLKTAEFVARGFRPSGIFGPLGAAAAVALLDDLDMAQTESALAIAANTSAGLREWANAGSLDIYAHNGFAARNGFRAARLAGAGFDGPITALEGTAGMGNAFGGANVDWSQIQASLSGQAAVESVQFKRFPACSALQTVLALALRLAARPDFDPRDVGSVTVHTHRHGKDNPGCDSIGPWRTLGQAQMSNQLGVALALLDSRLDVDAYRSRDDERVLDLVRRITVVEDRELTASYPATSGARLTVELTNGSRIVDALEREQPLTADEVDKRFVAAISHAYAAADAKRILETVNELDGAQAIREFTAPLRHIAPVAHRPEAISV